ETVWLFHCRPLEDRGHRASPSGGRAWSALAHRRSRLDQGLAAFGPFTVETWLGLAGLRTSGRLSAFSTRLRMKSARTEANSSMVPAPPGLGFWPEKATSDF